MSQKEQDIKTRPLILKLRDWHICGRKKCLFPLILNWIVFIVNGIYNRILDLLEKLSLGSKQFSIIKQKHGSRYTCIYAAWQNEVGTRSIPVTSVIVQQPLTFRSFQHMYMTYSYLMVLAVSKHCIKGHLLKKNSC